MVVKPVLSSPGIDDDITGELPVFAEAQSLFWQQSIRFARVDLRVNLEPTYHELLGSGHFAGDHEYVIARRDPTSYVWPTGAKARGAVEIWVFDVPAELRIIAGSCYEDLPNHIASRSA